jgi:hypothetical protein
MAGVRGLFVERGRIREVDFVTRAGRTLTVIEAKSGRPQGTRGRPVERRVES